MNMIIAQINSDHNPNRLAMAHPETIDARLTNMFFFKHDVKEHGELVKHVPFTDFFKVITLSTSSLIISIYIYIYIVIFIVMLVESFHPIQESR